MEITDGRSLISTQFLLLSSLSPPTRHCTHSRMAISGSGPCKELKFEWLDLLVELQQKPGLPDSNRVHCPTSGLGLAEMMMHGI
ncbi:hypothetical protein AAG906_023906 [Vitis piasezkii]